MNERLARLYRQLLSTIVQTPLEIAVSVFYWLILLMHYEDVWSFGEDHNLWTFPVSLSVVYSTNLFTKNTKYRWLYYGSAILLLLSWNLRFRYLWVAILVSQICILLGRKYSDNERFICNTVNYVADLCSALLLVSIGQCMISLIYYSFAYIFDISISDSSYWVYSLTTSYFLFAPLIFLMFNLKREPVFIANRFFKVLCNFILSPALLIYMGLLYLYIGKVILIWSLPEGGVSYVIMIFIILAIIIKSVQFILPKYYYNWFYNKFSLWISPALIMLWVSFLYRVVEYGFTEMRVYLFLIVLLLTATIVLLFISRYARYSLIAVIVAIVFTVFTYIPGITAADWGVYYQQFKVKSIAQKLDILDSEGHLRPMVAQDLDDSTELVNNLLDAFYYLQSEKGEEYLLKTYGVNVWQVKDSILHEKTFTSTYETYRRIYLDYYPEQYDLRGYSTFMKVHSYKKQDRIYSSFQEGKLMIQQSDSLLFDIAINEWIGQRLKDTGVDLWDDSYESMLKPYFPQIMYYRTEEFMLIFDRIVYDVRDQNVTQLDIHGMLIK